MCINGVAKFTQSLGWEGGIMGTRDHRIAKSELQQHLQDITKEKEETEEQRRAAQRLSEIRRRRLDFPPEFEDDGNYDPILEQDKE